MKKLALILMLLMPAPILLAQQNDKQTGSPDDFKTVFDKNGKTTIGWFVGPAGGYTKFSTSDVALAGIHAGMVINHNFSIGLAGFGVANSHYLTYNNIVDTAEVRLEGGYGGLLLEYTLFPKSAVHVTFPVLIGGGHMSYITTNEYAQWDGDDWDDHCTTVSSDPFFVVEPGVKAEVNLLKFMRFGIGVSYRYTPDLDLKSTSSSFINNFTAGASLKFGKF